MWCEMLFRKNSRGIPKMSLPDLEATNKPTTSSNTESPSPRNKPKFLSSAVSQLETLALIVLCKKPSCHDTIISQDTHTFAPWYRS